MTWVSGIAIYVIIWWTVIFAVLPFGVQPIAAEQVSKGHAAGAPRRPRILPKAALTSAISAILWLIVYWLFESGAVAFINDVATH
jgi:predicted secreted protein